MTRTATVLAWKPMGEAGSPERVERGEVARAQAGGQELAFTMGQGGADVTIRNFKGAVLLRRRK